MVKFLKIILLIFTFTVCGKSFVATQNGMVSVIPIKRENLAPQRKYFDAQNLQLKCRIKSKYPVQVAMFVKDKDGRYFQSDKQWKLNGNNEWQTLTIPIDEANNHWRAFSNYAEWSALQVVSIFEIGVSFWSENAQDVSCEIKDVEFTSKRRLKELQILNIQQEKNNQVGTVLPVKFQLSREYFNPFDPKDISVDCEWIAPNGKKHTFPAFYSSDYLFKYSITTEEAIASGSPYWELRYLPRVAGKHKFRIVAKDTHSTTKSEWQTITINDAPFKGLVRVSKKNHQFFEYENGELFFPLGLNIHANIDFRAEMRLGIFPLADCGLRDYEEYFKQCSKSGINCIEVWMASWTFGLQWSSRRYDYHGIGRYNLANANRLDKLLKLAKKYGILINLVWDNHGKFSLSPTQEWHENPFNKESKFAKSDGGFLSAADNLFANKKFIEYFNQKSRYIAARYGQNPQIFAQELWSEVDLVMNFRQRAYADKSADNWHAEVIKKYLSYAQEKHLITTHVCGDYKNNLRFMRLWEAPQITHLVGDSYRSLTIPMYEQMRQHNLKLIINKPRLITEFGGPSSGSANEVLEADLHTGLWSSIFQKQAGTPFLWWHDFVILGNRLQHFSGLNSYLKGVDLRDKEFECREVIVTMFPNWITQPKLKSLKSWERYFEGMILMKKDEVLGWIFNTEQAIFWEKRTENLFSSNYWQEVQVKLPLDFVAGKYNVKFYDTLSGKIIIEEDLQLINSLDLPPFEGDIAFKLKRLK